MKKLNLKKIKQIKLSSGDFVFEKTNKTQIVLHHTAGNSSGVNTFNGWKSDNRGRIATCVCISGKGKSKNTYDGEIVQGFSSRYWAYHLGLKGDVFRSFDLPYKRLDKTSIGVEICNWGSLTKRGEKFYNYVNREVPKEQVCTLKKAYKGKKHYHAYTDAQIESVRQLLVYWNEVYNIPLDYIEENLWSLSKDALSGKPGIYTHNSYRTDKSDISPQPKMIAMLKELKKKVDMAKKKKDVKIDAQVGENKLSIDKNDDEVKVVYDGKKRDIEYHATDERKKFIYDGEKLDVLVEKDKDNTEVKVEASNAFLRWIGKLMSKFVLRRKK